MRHHSQRAKKLKQKNPRSNAWCRYRCWWWRWCAQGPTRRHFGYLRSIFESHRNKLLSSSDPHLVTLFWHIFWHAIRESGIRILSHIFSAILSGTLSGISSEILCGRGPAGITLIINFDVFVVVVGVVAVAVAFVVAVVCFLVVFVLLVVVAAVSVP